MCVWSLCVVAEHKFLSKFAIGIIYAMRLCNAKITRGCEEEEEEEEVEEEFINHCL